MASYDLSSMLLSLQLKREEPQVNPLFKSAISISSPALVIALALLLGCSSDEKNGTSEGPWVTIQEDEMSSVGARRKPNKVEFVARVRSNNSNTNEVL